MELGGRVREGFEVQLFFSPPTPSNADRQQVVWQSENASFLLKTHLRPFGRGSAVFSKETRDQAYSFFFFFFSS